MHFIAVKSEQEIIWQLTLYIKATQITVCSNKHRDGNSLISVANGVIYFVGPVKFTQNHYYENIIKLHLSVIICKGYVALTKNHARQILKAKGGSYFLLLEYSKINISENTVYIVAKQARTFGDDSQPICPIQFYSTNGNLDDKLLKLHYRVMMLNNIHMISKDLPGEDLSFNNCTWMAGTAFHLASARIVHQKVFRVTNIPVNKSTERTIPLSVCPCSISNDGDCYSSNFGSLYPGQTITVRLIVPKRWVKTGSSSTTLIVANTPDDDCSIVESHQLSQTHFNNGCNNYSFTVWPSNPHLTECKLFIGLNEMPEMFFVQIKPCPMGFTVQQNKKACYCDPALNGRAVQITSCSLDDGTILRPANSWISAKTNNGSHLYLVSLYCPLDYCMPHTFYFDLSVPNSQCQFNRTGVLCGQCQHGLSAVFGSSQCQHCSNICLLIIIPIAIAGILLVIVLFIFNLTVINGTINTFIFYINIVNINITTFFRNCRSTICTILSLFNLDLGIKTCFYSGMDDYTKTWLQLVFPSYLFAIAILLIIVSRRSRLIQRVTAQRALPVLATLFLLSYTKMLRTACNVLFWYYKIIHLPSQHITLAWSVDPNAPLYSFKFIIMVVSCSILLCTLLIVNFVLLFSRKLSRFKLITTFKPLLDAYFAPYKDKYFYWTGAQLLIRAIIFGFSAFDVDTSLTAISILLGALISLQGVLQPFKSKYENIQESFVLFNLLAAHVATSYNTRSELASVQIVQIFFILFFVHFTIVIGVHCCLSTCKELMLRNYRRLSHFIDTIRIVPKMNNSIKAMEMNKFHDRIPNVACNYKEFQEPLVEFEN